MWSRYITGTPTQHSALYALLRPTIPDMVFTVTWPSLFLPLQDIDLHREGDEKDFNADAFGLAVTIQPSISLSKPLALSPGGARYPVSMITASSSNPSALICEVAARSPS